MVLVSLGWGMVCEVSVICRLGGPKAWLEVGRRIPVNAEALHENSVALLSAKIGGLGHIHHMVREIGFMEAINGKLGFTLLS